MTSPAFRIAISGMHHSALVRHLHPGDGLEAAAILLCSHAEGLSTRLCVKRVVPIPYEACDRGRDFVTWPTNEIESALTEAKAEGLSILLIHSHPSEVWEFSEKDDESDREVVPDLYDELQKTQSWVGTALVTRSGSIKARIYGTDGTSKFVEHVLIAGHDIRVLVPTAKGLPRPMPFTSGMRAELAGLCACVVGISGTGSVVAEQLARLGFGRIILIDPDWIEVKNLNRILNSRSSDAYTNRLKTERFKEAILSYRTNAIVHDLPISIENRDAVLMAAQADVLFSCVDSAIGRQMCDLIASSFVIPLFDVGVTIPTAETEGHFEIADVFGRIDYVQPGLSSLFDRGVYSQASLRAEELAESDPERYASELAEGYIVGAPDEAPSVISLNMRAASAVVNEFVARAYPYRFRDNEYYARTEFSLAAMEEEYYPENCWTQSSTQHLLGRGNAEPLLGIPNLGINKRRGVA